MHAGAAERSTAASCTGDQAAAATAGHTAQLHKALPTQPPPAPTWVLGRWVRPAGQQQVGVAVEQCKQRPLLLAHKVAAAGSAAAAALAAAFGAAFTAAAGAACNRSICCCRAGPSHLTPAPRQPLLHTIGGQVGGGRLRQGRWTGRRVRAGQCGGSTASPSSCRLIFPPRELAQGANLQAQPSSQAANPTCGSRAPSVACSAACGHWRSTSPATAGPCSPPWLPPLGAAAAQQSRYRVRRLSSSSAAAWSSLSWLHKGGWE